MLTKRLKDGGAPSLHRMTNNYNQLREDFYNRVASILEIDHTYIPRQKFVFFNRETNQVEQCQTDKTRWAGRNPGNGRFPGFGLVRYFGDDQIQVITKTHCRTFSSQEEALDFISQQKI